MHLSPRQPFCRRGDKPRGSVVASTQLPRAQLWPCLPAPSSSPGLLAGLLAQVRLMLVSSGEGSSSLSISARPGPWSWAGVSGIPRVTQRRWCFQHPVHTPDPQDPSLDRCRQACTAVSGEAQAGGSTCSTHDSGGHSEHWAAAPESKGLAGCRLCSVDQGS